MAGVAGFAQKLKSEAQIVRGETAFSSESFRTSDRIPYKAHRNSNIANAQAPRVVKVEMYESLVFIL